MSGVYPDEKKAYNLYCKYKCDRDQKFCHLFAQNFHQSGNGSEACDRENSQRVVEKVDNCKNDDYGYNRSESCKKKRIFKLKTGVNKIIFSLRADKSFPRHTIIIAHID